MKKLIPIVIVLLVAVAALQFLPELNFFQEEERITSQGVVDKIKDVSELNTVEMYFSEIIDYENARKIKNLKIPFTEKSFIIQVKARVKAGVDLSTLTESDVIIRDEENTLTVRLPGPKITSKEILTSKAYSEKDGLFNEVKNDDTLKALETFQVDIENQALEYGILDIAKDNAQKALKNIFNVTGFDTVKILWK